MRSRIIAGLLILGSLLAVVCSGILVYRALYFTFISGSFLSAGIGVALAVGSLVFTLKSLGEAGEDAENRVKEMKLTKPVVSVTLSFAGSLLAIHFAGLSVSDYLEFLLSVLQL